MSSKSNFWNCCPKLLEFLPEKPCDLGKPTLKKSNKINKKPICSWWINSKKHNYCFWRYLHDNSTLDGSMDEATQPDLARLFGCSNATAYVMLKEALTNLKEIVENDENIEDLKLSLYNNEEFNLSDIINNSLSTWKDFDD